MAEERQSLSWLTLSMMMVAAVASIRYLPSMAVYGLGSIALYLIAVLFFFTPVVLVATELATGWRGGIYGWVTQAFGRQLAFFAVWYGWIQVLTWFPIVLAFAASALAYLIQPELAKSGVFISLFVIVVYWLSVFFALRGIVSLSKLASRLTVVGTLLPAAVLILLGVLWLLLGQPSQMVLSARALIPDVFMPAAQQAGAQKTSIDLWNEVKWASGHLVLMISNFVAFAGIEMNAIHARLLSQPQREIPRAIGLAVLIILLVFIPPTLSIALVLPASQTSLTAGVMQAYADFFMRFQMAWATPLMAVLLILGALAGVLTWTVGPSTGLLLAARSGALPRWWQATNRHGVQKNILLVQAWIVTGLAGLYVVIPDVSAAFWMLSAIAAQIYLVIYLLMFAAALRLRRCPPSVPHGFVCPHLPFWARLGMLVSCLAFLLGFVPPERYHTLSHTAYVAVLVTGLLVFALPPFLFYSHRQRRWQALPDSEVKLATAAYLDPPQS